MAPLREAEVDTLVLGCTHYPLLSGVIQLAIGDEVALVSSAEETSKDVLRVLTEGDMLNSCLLYTSPSPREVSWARRCV